MSCKILIIAPNWVGDTIMAQGLFKLLKQLNPDTVLDVMAPDWTFPVLNRMPEISTTLHAPLSHGKLELNKRLQLAKKIKQEGYDQAIVLPNSFKSALIPWLAHIPHRTGYKGEWRYGLLNDLRRLDKKRYPLLFEHYLSLGYPAGKDLPRPYVYPTLTVSLREQTEVLTKHQLDAKQPILALCPGAAYGPSKCWPIEYYAEIARTKLDEKWQVWLFGSEQDRPITNEIMALTQERCVNLAGQLVLTETIDLLSLTHSVVCNDSGLMHIAAALNKPLIVMYGSTTPRFTPPLSARAHILNRELDCQPCFQRHCPLEHFRCMREITPQSVLSILSKAEDLACASS